jgi:hypothetical protein
MDRQPRQHEHRHQPELTLAVPRPPRRPTNERRLAPTWSWARFNYQPGTQRWPVHQFGSRRLFDEVSAAYHQWDHAGRPPVTRWHFTITPDGQQVQLTDDMIRT